MPVRTRPDLLERGVERCERAGYDVSRPESGREPAALATPGAGAATLVPAGLRPVAVEPLAATGVTPTKLISRLWDAVDRDRAALFVVPEGEVKTALDVLRAPAFVAATDDDGRTFYNGPDRVPLGDGGYALARPGAAYRWREEPVDEARPDSDADGTRLVLRAANGPIAVLPGVDGLATPDAGTFPFSYRRGPEKRIRVHGSDGRQVGTFVGISALRDAGFEPVPMPLVPDHVFDGDATGAWAVLDREGRLHTGAEG